MMLKVTTIRIAVLAGSLLLLDGSIHAEDRSPTHRRDAIERGLAIVQKAAKNYPAHRQCFSCHHQTLPLLAMAEAREAGFKIDEEAFEATKQHTLKSFSSRLEKLRAARGIGGRANTVSYGLWALDVAGHQPDDTTAAMVDFLLKNQNEDGRWTPQSNRPPLEESPVAVTVLSSYYMRRFAQERHGDDVEKSIRKARAWLADAPLASQEDHAFGLWGLSLLADDSDADVQKRTDELRSNILAAQREDGGWAQNVKMESDAYATGQTLYVLSEVGVSPESDVVRAGVEFLLKTQQEGGSWRVETRSKPVQVFFDNGDPHGKSQFISIAATSWAVAALARAEQTSRAAAKSP